MVFLFGYEPSERGHHILHDVRDLHSLLIFVQEAEAVRLFVVFLASSDWRCRLGITLAATITTYALDGLLFLWGHLQLLLSSGTAVIVLLILAAAFFWLTNLVTIVVVITTLTYLVSGFTAAISNITLCYHCLLI